MSEIAPVTREWARFLELEERIKELQAENARLREALDALHETSWCPTGEHDLCNCVDEHCGKALEECGE